MIVDFIVCGSQKCGTTTLDAYLRDHPELSMAKQKEVHFFDNERYFLNSGPNYDIYHSFFPADSPHKLTGETTPIYMYWRNSAQRIWQYNPNIKLIVILRNPIDRAYSHWNMQQSRKLEKSNFGEALRLERKRHRGSLPYQNRIYSYVDRGFYTNQLRRLWSFFPKKNVLIVKSEKFRANPQVTMNDIHEFLGVSEYIYPDIKERHIGNYTSRMGRKERKYLQHVFEYEISSIERLLGWNCSDWLYST